MDQNCHYRYWQSFGAGCKPYHSAVEEISATAEDAGTFRSDTRIEILRKELSNGKTTYRGSVRECNKERKYVNYLSETTLRALHNGRLAAYRPRQNRAGGAGRASKARIRDADSEYSNQRPAQDGSHYPDRARVGVMAEGANEETPGTGSPVTYEL